MKTLTFKTYIASVTAVALGVAAQAQAWDFAADYLGNVGNIVNQNPGGQWTAMSLDNNAARGSWGDYTTMANQQVNYYGLPGINGWSRYSGNSQPVAFVNTSGTDYIPGEGITIPGSLTLAPGSSEYALVRWTAPSSGIIDIGYGFAEGQGGGNGVTVFVDHVSALTLNNLFGNTLPDRGSAAGSILNFSVNAGDYIDWVVGNNGDFAADWSVTVATVSYIPEPGSMALMGLGALALLWRRRAVAS